MAPTEVIRRVREDGGVDLIARYSPDTRTLEVLCPGFPLLGMGTHRVEGDLPTVFYDMHPAGYLGRRFVRAHPQMGLPADPTHWRREQILRVLTEAGHDLAGNLIVGEESWRRFQHRFGRGHAPGPTRDVAPAAFGRFVDETLDASDEGSSLGGERPKFAPRLADHGGWLVKFSPPLDTPHGRRWADVLRAELHAAETLRAHGIDAVRGRVIERDGRAFLALERFDRIPVRGGRRGVLTWYYLGASPPDIAAELRAEAWIGAEDHARFTRAHAFAAAMGNNDTHAGNYALAVSDDGAHTLAPLYDLAPMALAPRHDELPDARLRPWPRAADDEGLAMVRAFAARLEGDAEISREFVALWRRGAASSLR
jgi:hypothetical protein